ALPRGPPPGAPHTPGARRAGPPPPPRFRGAPRAATAALADAVAWLDGGRVRAVGTHEELWRDPEYRAVFGVCDGDASPDGARR
ncbi:hypothetical protein ACFW2E_38665, partial [Streptomyces sp. NPDC058964]